jgi:hypothetical protein
VTVDFKKATKNPHKTLKTVVQALVDARQAHLATIGSGIEPEGGDLNQAIDAWIVVLEEKNTIKEAREKTAKEIEEDHKASNIDREKMKKSISKKRARVESSDDEYTDISDDDDDENSLTSELPASPSLATAIRAIDSQRVSTSPSPSQACTLTTSYTNSLATSRAGTPIVRKSKKQKKSNLQNEFKLALYVLTSSISLRRILRSSLSQKCLRPCRVPRR